MAKPNPWILLGVVMVGNFLGPLNSSIATVALPNLMASLGADLSTISWVITGYMLGYAVSMPTAGWLADTFGRKRMYMTGLVIFTVASVFASLAWDPGSLIAFRILQAVGGGFLSATSMAVIVQYFPTHSLGRALGVWGLGMVLAPALGPYVGGYLIDLVDWRLIFLMGVPFGVVGLILSYALLPDDTERIHRPFDFVGFACLTASLLLFLYALSQGNTEGWDSPVIVGCIAGAAILFAVFIPWEMHSAHPLMELRLFQTWNFSIAVALRALLGAGYYMGIVLVPVFVQNLLGYTPLQSGAVLVPAGLAMALAMPIAGTLSDRLGARAFVVAGLSIATIASFYFRTLDTDWSFSLLASVMLWRSLGLGMLFTPLTSAALWNVPRNLGGGASGIINTVWQVGGSIGIAASTAYATIRFKARYTDLASHVTAYQPAVQQYLAQTSQWASMHGLSSNAALAMLQSRLEAAATVLSYQDAFVVSAIMLACAIPLAFALRRRPTGIVVIDIAEHRPALIEVAREEAEAL
jgi:EmrB/QacA subfamily drug resistance transporter